jgi:hypothetical protein
MIRVFWFNGGGAWHVDVPEPDAMQQVKHLASSGYLVWWQRLATLADR